MTAVRSDDAWLEVCRAAAAKLVSAAQRAHGREASGLKIFLGVNFFYWHIAQFERDQNPAPAFIDLCKRAVDQFDSLRTMTAATADQLAIEPSLAGEAASLGDVYSDVYERLTDEAYFSEGPLVLRSRLEVNGIAPEDFFGGKIVLDAGCGGGRYTHAIASLGAGRVIGVDLGEGNIRFARAQAAKSPVGAKLTYSVGSVLDLPVDDASVDLVWCNSVAHVTGNQRKCLTELNRVLKPGGILFYYVNGRFGLFQILLETLRGLVHGVPEKLVAKMLRLCGVDAGRISWVVACTFAPYEFLPRTAVEGLLAECGFTDCRLLSRGHSYDFSERISRGEPYAQMKFGEGQLRYVAMKGC
ncbi:MAG: class I SAM-dependent methyltransferase [Alphaproteobacteria bacterium]